MQRKQIGWWTEALAKACRQLEKCKDSETIIDEAFAHAIENPEHMSVWREAMIDTLTARQKLVLK